MLCFEQARCSVMYVDYTLKSQHVTLKYFYWKLCRDAVTSDSLDNLAAEVQRYFLK